MGFFGGVEWSGVKEQQHSIRLFRVFEKQKQVEEVHLKMGRERIWGMENWILETILNSHFRFKSGGSGPCELEWAIAHHCA